MNNPDTVRYPPLHKVLDADIPPESRIEVHFQMFAPEDRLKMKIFPDVFEKVGEAAVPVRRDRIETDPQVNEPPVSVLALNNDWGFRAFIEAQNLVVPVDFEPRHDFRGIQR